jgi:acetoin:2,6-dichlorophenolindophenol oxidoreductase subunit alpha
MIKPEMTTNLNDFFYREMFLIRKVEETLLKLFSKGLLRGTVHTCIGQEGCAVGVINALDKEKDIICSNHRGHGHFLAYCNDYKGLILEIMGRDNGICKGIGGSQHLHYKNFYSNGILGGMVPVTVGMALAEKFKKSDAIGVIFMGDGSLAEGIVYEAFNMAGLWKSPVLFVVEQNQYAQSTPYQKEHAGELSERVRPFGIKTTVSNGNHVTEVFEAAKKIVEEIRNSKQPQMLFLNTYRLAPHSKGDDLRDKSEIEKKWKNDPLAVLRMVDNNIPNEQIENEVTEKVEKFIEAIV